MFTPSPEPDLRILARLEWFERPALIVVAVVAGAIFLCWMFPPLAAFAPSGWHHMRAVTAGGLLLTALSLALSSPRSPPLALRLSALIGFALMVVPILVVASYLGLPFHPERWPMRPSAETAAAFAVAAACLPFIRCR